MGVLGSGENGVKKLREQRAWLLKGQGAKSREFWILYPKM